MLSLSSGTWITQFLTFIGGCFGLCANHASKISGEDPSNGIGIQGQLLRKSSISEGFWSASTYDLETTIIKSQGSFSNITIPNLSLCQYSSTGSTSSQDEFINQGYLQWNQNRLQWLSSKKHRNRKLVWNPVQDWYASYECTLESNKPFAGPIPLSELVDLLVDVWEEEGLYD